MPDADSRLIEWLLHESKVTRYKISKDVGISQPTLSRIANGETPMDVVRFGYARKLTEYARRIQSTVDMENQKQTDDKQIIQNKAESMGEMDETERGGKS